MPITDIIIVSLILLRVYSGVKRGISNEIIKTALLILSTFIAYVSAPNILNDFEKILEHFNLDSYKMVFSICLISTSYSFFISGIIIRIFKVLLPVFIKKHPFLNIIGGILSGLRASIIIGALILIINNVSVNNSVIEHIKDSKVSKYEIALYNKYYTYTNNLFKKNNLEYKDLLRLKNIIK